MANGSKRKIIKYTKLLKKKFDKISKISGSRIQNSPYLPEIMQTQQLIMGELNYATKSELDESVSILNQSFENILPGISFIAMVTIGAFVENGADPKPAYDSVIPYFENVFNHIENPAHISMIFQIGSMSYMAIVAILSKYKEGRKKIKEDKKFMAILSKIWMNFRGGEYIWEISNVLDDQIALVLHPELKKGYILNFGGIANGFQLQTLLEDILIQNNDSRFLSGTKNDPKLIAQMKNGPNIINESLNGYFSMFQAKALDENYRLPDSVFKNMDLWITGGTLPIEISKIDGKTCILLSKDDGNLKLNRSWNSQRRFPHMEASISIEKILTQSEVENYLKLIYTSNN